MEGSSIQAILALLLAVPLTFYLFKRYPAHKAGLYVFLGSLLFLPELAFMKLPLFPELEKHRIPALSSLAAIFFLAPTVWNRRVEWWWYLLALLGFAEGVGTYLTNPESYYYPIRVVQGLNFKDGMYVSISALTASVLTAWLGLKLFRGERDLKLWVTTLVGCGLLYAGFILIELRFSPQVHRWTYGYHPHESFGQAFRFGGYRPQMYMAHGLALSLFMLGTAVCAVLLARYKQRIWKLSGSQAAWILTIIVVLCKSSGVWFYALFTLPLVRWASPKTIMRVALVVLFLAVAYPWLRATGRVPVEEILDYANRFNADRSASLKFRFDNETLLVEHALKKVWFGWSSSYGRNRVYDDWGYDISTTDGGWIIAFGSGGMLGLFEYFGFAVFPILTIWRRMPRIRDVKQRTMLAALTLYVAVCWFDVIPNGSFNRLPHFMGAALCAISGSLVRERLKKPAPRTREKAEGPAPGARACARRRASASRPAGLSQDAASTRIRQVLTHGGDHACRRDLRV